MYGSLWNMIEKVREHSKAFDLNQLYAVKQWLDHFKWHEEGSLLMGQLLDEVEKERRDHALANAKGRYNFMRKRVRKEPDPREPEPESIGVTVGFCPRCESRLVGMPVGSCEAKAHQRHFYTECVACIYYREVFKRGNKYYEVEGG